MIYHTFWPWDGCRFYCVVSTFNLSSVVVPTHTNKLVSEMSYKSEPNFKAAAALGRLEMFCPAARIRRYSPRRLEDSETHRLY